MIRDYAHAAILQERHESPAIAGAYKPSRMFGPGTTPLSRDIMAVKSDLVRSRQFLEIERADRERGTRYGLMPPELRERQIARMEAELAALEARQVTAVWGAS